MKKNGAKAAWDTDRDEVVRMRYPTENTQLLARKIGITVGSLTRRACQLGVKKATHHKRQTNTEELRVIASGTVARKGNVTTHMIEW